MVPVVLIIEIVRENNVFDIKYMLEGENLVHDDGREFRLFLKQSTFVDEKKDEDMEEEFKESSFEYIDAMPPKSSNSTYDADLLFAQKLQAEMYSEQQPS